MSEEVKSDNLPPFAEVVATVAQHRMMLQGLALALHELRGQVYDLQMVLEAALAEGTDEVIEVEAKPVEEKGE